MEEIIGEIRFFTLETLPDDKVFKRCDGTKLDYTEHEALFSLIGYSFTDNIDGTFFMLPIIDPIFVNVNGNQVTAMVAYITVKGIYPNGAGLTKINSMVKASNDFANYNNPI